MKKIEPGAHARAGAEQVLEVVSPTIDELAAVHQSVDQLIAPARIFARQELLQLFWRRNAACRIQPHTARELSIAGQAGVRDPVPFHATEDEIIDVITAFDFPRGGHGGRERRRQIRCHPSYRSGAIFRGLNQRSVNTLQLGRIGNAR